MTENKTNTAKENQKRVEELFFELVEDLKINYEDKKARVEIYNALRDALNTLYWSPDYHL